MFSEQLILSLSFNLKCWRGHFTLRPCSPQLLSPGDEQGPAFASKRDGNSAFCSKDRDRKRSKYTERKRKKKECYKWREATRARRRGILRRAQQEVLVSVSQQACDLKIKFLVFWVIPNGK